MSASRHKSSSRLLSQCSYRHWGECAHRVPKCQCQTAIYLVQSILSESVNQSLLSVLLCSAGKKGIWWLDLIAACHLCVPSLHVAGHWPLSVILFLFGLCCPLSQESMTRTGQKSHIKLPRSEMCNLFVYTRVNPDPAADQGINILGIAARAS